jgi:hypothetical protein
MSLGSYTVFAFIYPRTSRAKAGWEGKNRHEEQTKRTNCSWSKIAVSFQKRKGISGIGKGERERAVEERGMNMAKVHFIHV